MIVPAGSTDSLSTVLISYIQRILLVTALMILAVILSACNQSQEASGPRYSAEPQKETPLRTYHVAVHPLHNPVLKKVLPFSYSGTMPFGTLEHPGMHSHAGAWER